MKLHPNAKTTPLQRELLVERVDRLDEIRPRPAVEANPWISP